MQAIRILIVGAGKLGLPLAHRLAEQTPVAVLSRRPPLPAANVLPLMGDVTRPETLEALPREIEVLIYCVTPGSHEDAAYQAVFVAGLENVLRALDHSALRRVIFVSSTGVYGQDDGSWVDEASPTEPVGFSGRRLLEAEQLLRSQAVPSSAVRFSGIYGPDRTRLLMQILAGELALEADGPYTNRIHETDCIGILEHLARKALTGEALAPCYLASDCEPSRIQDVVEWVGTQVDALSVREDAEPPVRRAGSKRCCNRRLLEAGFQFRYPSFREGYGEILRQMSER